MFEFQLGFHLYIMGSILSVQMVYIHDTAHTGKYGLYALYHDHMQRQQGPQGVYLAHPYHFALVSDYSVKSKILPQFGVECILCGHNEL